MIGDAAAATGGWRRKRGEVGWGAGRNRQRLGRGQNERRGCKRRGERRGGCQKEGEVEGEGEAEERQKSSRAGVTGRDDLEAEAWTGCGWINDGSWMNDCERAIGRSKVT